MPESKALLDGLLAGLVDAVVVTDSRGTVVRVSESARTMLGWPPGDLEGQNVKVLMPDPYRSEHDDYLQRYADTGRTWILGSVRQFDVVRRDGIRVPMELSVSRIDVEGDVGPYFCGTFRDVSDGIRVRKALERSEARFRAIFDNENQSVLLLDAEGRVVEANQPTLKRSGTTVDRVVGQLLEDLPFWGSAEKSRSALQRLRERALDEGVATVRLGVRIRREDGGLVTPHEVSMRVVPQSESSLPGAIVEIRDISALVAAQRRESSVLRSLARLGEEAAMLSHELRSPVSELELALKAVARQLGEDERALIETLGGRMRRLEQLMQRTLRFSRPLELERTSVEAGDAFGEAIAREHVALQSAGIRPSVHVAPGTPPLDADAAVLGDLLSNLLRNSVQAQEGSGRGALRLEASDGGGGRVLLAVEDDGAGIPVADREDVLRPFHTTKEEGTGLGLALCLRIVEEHGATLRLADGVTLGGLRAVIDWPAAGGEA